MKDFFKSKIDSLYWKKDEGVFNYTVLKEEQKKPFAHLQPRFENTLVNQKFAYDNQHWWHKEVVFCIKDELIIEPSYGIVLNNKGVIFPSSHQFPTLFPSVPRFIQHKWKKTTTHLPKAVLFDGGLGANYFHFFSDVLSKIWVLEAYLDIENTPLIINHSTYKKPFFQSLLQKEPFNRMNWHVQKANVYFSVNELYFAKPMPYAFEHWSKNQNVLGVEDYPLGDRKIFLNRSKESGRYIENFSAIAPVLKAFQFEIVDTNGWTLAQQIALLRSTRYLVGIHGAGMTNIFLRGKQPLSILEIDPANRISCHYYWLANVLGYNYDVMLGRELPFTNTYPEKGFTVNPDLLEQYLEKLL